MKGYITVGTNNLARSAAFYVALFEELGFTRRREVADRAVYFGTEDDVQLVVITPADGQPATAGNGTMVALNVDTQEQVQRLHARAMIWVQSMKVRQAREAVTHFMALTFATRTATRLPSICVEMCHGTKPEKAKRHHELHPS